MDRLAELRKKVAEIRNQIKDLKEKGKRDEAHAMIQNLAAAEAEVKREEEIQNAIKGPEGRQPLVPENKNEMNINAIFNKLILNRAISEEEKRFYANSVAEHGQVETVGNRGGYLVPLQQFKEIQEEKRRLVSLEQYCRVQPVSTNAGSMPVKLANKGRLIAFDEINKINSGELAFDQIEFKLKSYGLLIPVSNELLEDAFVSVGGIIKTSFAKSSVLTKNDKILDIVKAAKAVPGATWQDLGTAINTKLDPSIAAGAIIITNQTSFNYLDSQQDTNGRPLLSPNIQDASVKMFRGKTLVVLADETLPASAPGVFDFYVGDMKEAVCIFDRNEYRVKESSEAGFSTNSTVFRVVERFDVVAMDKEAAVHVAITVKGK